MSLLSRGSITQVALPNCINITSVEASTSLPVHLENTGMFSRGRAHTSHWQRECIWQALKFSKIMLLKSTYNT